MMQPATHNAAATQHDYIRIERVSKDFDGVLAVDDVSLNVPKGEIFALLGSSGCGKSTLLRMLAGFETPSSGRIFIDGEDMVGISPHMRPTNMMFQSYALFPHMTVFDNVAFGLRQDRVSASAIKDRVAELLEMVQMGAYGLRKPHQLSGGQRQRVALARSLAKRPKLLLLDEPMGALDRKLRERMQLELVDIIEGVGVTCIMVTHDQEEAMTMASRIAIMNEGHIVQVGPPREIYEFPNCRFAAEFIGTSNTFKGTVLENENAYVTVGCDDLPAQIHVSHGISGPDDMRVWVAIRPEKIEIDRKDPQQPYNWARGVVKDIAYFGDMSIYHVQLPSGKIVLCTMAYFSKHQEVDPPTWGEQVYISWDSPDSVVLTS